MAMTTSDYDIRPGEVTVEVPEKFDGGLYFIGSIRTPWKTRAECPKRGDPDNGPVCRIEIDPLWRPALDGIDVSRQMQVLYWMDRARRDLVRQSPRSDGKTRGTFSLRSPVRPNPIASSVVNLVGVEDGAVLVKGLDCLDDTPLVDLKPVYCDHAD
jgi:tRNA-Thr(GGU) m(6)t(6)A37 methyltransferase TsaA